MTDTYGEWRDSETNDLRHLCWIGNNGNTPWEEYCILLVCKISLAFQQSNELSYIKDLASNNCFPFPVLSILICSRSSIDREG